MRLLFLDAQLGEPIEDFVSLDFQLPRQLVDPNLLHRKSNLLLAAVPQYLTAILALVWLRTLGQRGAFRTFSLSRIVSGGTRVFYRTKLFRRFFVFGCGG